MSYQQVMKIVATPIKAIDLEPGDLFSTEGPDYWNDYQHRQSIGERVYIRTGTPGSDAPDANAVVYRIEIRRLSLALRSPSKPS